MGRDLGGGTYKSTSPGLKCYILPCCTIKWCSCIYSVMNVTPWKTLLRLWFSDILCHIPTACWRLGVFCYSSSLHYRECLSRDSVYLNFLYNPVPQGNWPHSYYWNLLHEETALASLCRRKSLVCIRDLFGFNLNKVSHAECL